MKSFCPAERPPTRKLAPSGEIRDLPLELPGGAALGLGADLLLRPRRYIAVLGHKSVELLLDRIVDPALGLSLSALASLGEALGVSPRRLLPHRVDALHPGDLASIVDALL